MKQFFRKSARLMCQVAVWPAVVLFRLQAIGNPQGAESGFAGWSEWFSLLPGTAGVYLRHAFFRRTMLFCDEDACISFGTVFSGPQVSIGRTVYVGRFCSIGEVTIEDDVLVASHVSIMNGCHQHGTNRLDIPIREQPGRNERITVGRGSWIGERATIAASVGQQCVIGAGALVLKPIPDFSVAVGVPARVIADRRPSASAVLEAGD